MADSSETAFRRGLGRILSGISLLLFAILLALIGLPFYSGGGESVAALAIGLIGVIGLVMGLTGYGEITEGSPPGR